MTALFGQIAFAAPTGMVLIEGGTFQMGSPEWEDAIPVHSVTVNSFYMGIHEVTQQEWVALMGNNPSWIKGEELPVEQVTWNDVIDYCNTRSLAEGLTPVYTRDGNTILWDSSANGYRLPTEAEWEYAASGGSNAAQTFRYSGSDTLDDVGWYDQNGGRTTHAVGSKAPNSLGLYDMSGNVWEWCWDWYDNGFYRNSPPVNPTGPENGSERVIRGGSWFFDDESCLIQHRGSRPPNTRICIGFRLVRNAE
jgi:formylglycine-generating enzyme required for sulfatase activity